MKEITVGKLSLALLVIALVVSLAPSLQAANLTILETKTGVVFQGDANFTANDWGGLISMTTGAETGTVSANLSAPAGHSGTFNFNILDANGALSDTLIVNLSATPNA